MARRTETSFATIALMPAKSCAEHLSVFPDGLTEAFRTILELRPEFNKFSNPYAIG